jgi:mannose-6-phosphate isomerase-like protein (cupin superfamily)
MEVIKFSEETGVNIPYPYKREIKVLLAPDKRDVPEIIFTQAIIDPNSKTDYHKHDRPELIIILSGKGISICDSKEVNIEPEMALWVRKDEMHQIINMNKEPLKLATVFVPAFTSDELLKNIFNGLKNP